jgi:DNA polymerase-1
VKQYINDTISTARTRGYVNTLLGRRRYLPDLNSRNQNIRGNAERQAINMPIQGTAADMIKVAMIGIDREVSLKGWRSRMLLQVHDELIFEVARSEIGVMDNMVRDRMMRALTLAVPIEVDIGTGSNWLEAH